MAFGGGEVDRGMGGGAVRGAVECRMGMICCGNNGSDERET